MTTAGKQVADASNSSVWDMLKDAMWLISGVREINLFAPPRARGSARYTDPRFLADARGNISDSGHNLMNHLEFAIEPSASGSKRKRGRAQKKSSRSGGAEGEGFGGAWH